jgi:hypothetical protein
MNVSIIDVNQRYSLQSRSFSNVITLQLPNGARVLASVEDDVLQTILATAQGYPAAVPVEGARDPVAAAQAQGYSNVTRLPTAHVPPPPAYTPPPPPPGYDNPEENPFLATEAFDGAPQQTPVPPEPGYQLDHHVDQGEVEWETLPDTQLPPQVRQIMKLSGVPPRLSIADLDRLKLEITTRLAQRPKAGEVNWESGPRRQVESTRIRTVPRDEAGNPIPPGGILEMRDSNDPGEVREEEDALQA